MATTRSVTPVSATPSSRSLTAAETIPLRFSHANTVRHAGPTQAQHVSPISITREGALDKTSALERLRVSSNSAQRLADSIPFEEALANIRPLNSTLYAVLENYHEATRRVRSDEQEWMGKILAYHAELERFPRRVNEKRLTQAEVDAEMDRCSAQLLEYDSQLKAWLDHRAHQNAVMASGNDHAMEENVRRQQERICREDHDRRSGGLGRCIVDGARRLKEHDRWVLEYTLWVQMYARFSRDRTCNLKEYRELVARQAHFSRRIGNYQIARYFQEVELLNETGPDHLQEKPSPSKKSEGSDETSRRQKRASKEGIEPTEALEGSQGAFDDWAEHMAAEKRRRHSW